MTDGSLFSGSPLTQHAPCGRRFISLLFLASFAVWHLASEKFSDKKLDSCQFGFVVCSVA
jgi:hypothetical protein